MKNAVIVTAKGSNQSVANKNVIPVLGVPVVAYPIRAAKLSVLTDCVYVSTEDSMIGHIAEREGAIVLPRPPELSRPESLHKDVIQHCVSDLLATHPTLQNVIILLGNTVQVTAGLIDQCFRKLETDDCDSVMTGWRAQDDHPFRAMTVDDNGHVQSFMNATDNSNRQSYPDVFFYDQGVWAFKVSCALAQKGPKPWVWLGEKCRLIERPWVTGRDIHSWIDVSASVWYLNAIQANDFMDYKGL